MSEYLTKGYVRGGCHVEESFAFVSCRHDILSMV